MKLRAPGPNTKDNVQYLAGVMQECLLEPLEDVRPGGWRGGRQAALAALAAWNPEGYARRRNDTADAGGCVSRLSPYLRHGVLGLREVAAHVERRVGRTEDALKFWAELGWREFWQRVWRHHGTAIHEDLEVPKVPLGRREQLPEDIVTGRTGLACMDAFVRELVETGWMHNHARMWFASYVVHFRKVDWRAGARFFYQHLLDGDPASNSLSWQWVASTFSHKPYIFNRENLERHTAGVHCRVCSAACPFQGSYGTLEARLFAGDRPHDP
jgi:deoxyribodipyrimidine photo-lyase